MTIKDFLNRAAETSPNRVALKYKQSGEWKTTSYDELYQRARQVSELLAGLGVVPGDRVAIYCENCPEWFELYYGTIGIGAVAVPVDAKLREQEIGHIFHDCGVTLLFCSARNVPVVFGMDGRKHELRNVVVLDGADVDFPSGERVAYHDYGNLRRKAPVTEDAAYDRYGPQENDPASLLYTSGTTGRQKGAVLTHRNFTSNVESIIQAIDFGPSDNIMLVLPLHHSFAFTCTLLVSVACGCQVSFVENLKTIKSNMEECAPTVLLAVPLLLEKMLARIMGNIKSNAVARVMYRCGMARVVGKKVNQGLGGAVRLMVSGGAPISRGTLRSWSKLGFPIVEGYGITETAPVLSVNPIGSPRVGTVGLPIKDVEIRIHEPNEQGIGEIIAHGPNVMQGYYNNPEATAEVLRDGWYHTGDMGRFDAKGYLVVCGRKKSLIVNREGKNIYPEEVELQVLKSRYVLECIALGYREPNHDAGEKVGLLVVPNLEQFESLEDRNGKRLTDQEIEEIVRGDVVEKLQELSDYKRPRKIQIRFEEFEKTTTQKIKRYLYAIDTSRP
jgi:long-chain acyl-CoA synthetase